MNRTDWLLAAVLTLGACASLKLWNLAGGVDVLVRSRLDATQSARTEWREREGMATSLTTWRDAREDEEEFVTRHERSVHEMTEARGREADAWKVQRR